MFNIQCSMFNVQKEFSHKGAKKTGKEMNEMREYVDDTAHIVKVSAGISGGKFWMACRVKPSGALQRVKSKFLPVRNKREEAQADLDRYAEERGWPLIAEGVTA